MVIRTYLITYKHIILHISAYILRFYYLLHYALNFQNTNKVFENKYILSVQTKSKVQMNTVENQLKIPS